MNHQYQIEGQQLEKLLEDRAMHAEVVIPDECLPTKQYLQKYILPHVEAAMKATAETRPTNALQFFSYYLLVQRNK